MLASEKMESGNVKQLDQIACYDLEQLKKLAAQLIQASHTDEKIALLEAFLSRDDKKLLQGLLLKQDELYLMQATFAIKQGHRLYDFSKPVSSYKQLLKELKAIDTFYQEFGGIVGYQCMVLSLLKKNANANETIAFYPPQGTCLQNENDPVVRQAILSGIRNQPKIAELYPVGGAADRLALKDKETGKELPAACLIFQGKHLLEGMIHDLQAREYLYYKLHGKNIRTPIALMTSGVNQNHELIQEICKKNGWFGRSEKSFRFFKQPSVPMFTKEGDWCLKKPAKLLLRPGGHGVIWKLALEEGILDWFISEGKEKTLVRQINNPMAAVDYGLCAFLGIGYEKGKVFGFASCERRVNAQEGMNVLKVIEKEGKKQVALTNVEYCDFEKFAIDDKPKEENSHYSLFPSNTNILFVDLKALKEALSLLPFPGLLLNFRSGSHFVPEKGVQKEKIARLETTMQNIADAFSVPFDKKMPEELPTYVTFNERRKTISTTKRKTARDGKLLETPEGCFYDFMQNAEELLDHHCGMKLIPVENETMFFKEGPSFLMRYHPSLGPFYSIIKQKIQGGEIVAGSELQLEIADLFMKNLFLEGSLLIFSEAIMGHADSEGNLIYSEKTGQCSLRDIRVENEGIDWNADDHLFWKHEIRRKASLTIHLKGHSRFDAESVVFKGNHVIEVPDGMHTTAIQKGDTVYFDTRPLEKTDPFWSYTTSKDHQIRLS